MANSGKGPMPAAGPTTTATAVIEAGSAFSAGVDTTAKQVVCVMIPADWESPQTLSFQVSADGTNWGDLCDADGHEQMIRALAETAIAFPNNEWITGVGWIRFRSGTRERPVPQPAARTLTVFLL